MSPTPPSSHQRSIQLSLVLYRTLLVAYPAAFRRAYGAQMLQVFRDRCRQATQAQGRRGLLALWVPTLADLFRTALAERLATTRPLARPFLSRLCGLLLLVSASLTLLLDLYALVYAWLGLSLHLPTPELLGFTAGDLVVAVPLFSVWGLLGLLLRSRTWFGWLGGSLALLGQLLFISFPLLDYWWLTPDDAGAIFNQYSGTSGFAPDPAGAIHLIAQLLGLVGLVVAPLGLLLFGLAVWRARMLGPWSVVGLLLFLATGLQLWGWLPAMGIGLPFGMDSGGEGMNFLLFTLELGVFSWPLWAGLGYALWVRPGTPVAGPEPLAPSILP
jgi:hypothetical protein